MKDLLDRMVTQNEFASLVGVDHSAVSRWLSNGHLSPNGTCLDWLREYTSRLREQAAGRMGNTEDGLDPAQETAALRKAQREGYEIKNAVLRGEYAPIVLLAKVLATASQSVTERIELIPSTLSKTCPDLPEDARERVMSVITEAKNEWARATVQLITEQLTGDELEGDQ